MLNLDYDLDYKRHSRNILWTVVSGDNLIIIKKRMEMGGCAKETKTRPKCRNDSQGQPMGLQQNEKIPHPDRNKDI